MFTDHVQMSSFRDITAVEVRKCSAVAGMTAQWCASRIFAAHTHTQSVTDSVCHWKCARIHGHETITLLFMLWQ